MTCADCGQPCEGRRCRACQRADRAAEEYAAETDGGARVDTEQNADVIQGRLGWESGDISEADPSNLRPHPKNTEIYGDTDDVDDLDATFKESVAEKGVLEPLLITDGKKIISGHRRQLAAIDAGLSSVPVRYAEFENELAEREALIEHNRQRQKNPGQIVNEAEEILELERERGKKKQGERTDLSDNSTKSSENHDSWKNAAEKVGVSDYSLKQGKKVKEKTEGALVEKVRSGPESTVDTEELIKKGLKRQLALHFDEDYMREVLKVQGMGVQSAFEWARNNNVPVSKGWIEQEYEKLFSGERAKYDSIDDIEREYRRVPTSEELQSISLRREDKRHKHPEITKEYEKNAVVIFIRDVSGSMRSHKRELVERVFTPLDWYLTGKYDEAKFHYIVHDSSAEEVDRNKFFGMKSGGGTRISTAYELTQEILESNYPWADWNRYVFAAGDGENFRDDSEKNVVPLMEEIDANLHAYLEVKSERYAVHGEIIERELGSQENVAVTYVQDNDDVMDSIEEILSTEDSE